MMLLGQTYTRGAMARRANEKAVNQVRSDPNLRCCGSGVSRSAATPRAQAILADRMQNGYGLSAPQPEASERYWRLAAQGGNAPTGDVRGPYAPRLRPGESRNMGAENEGIKLLQQVMSQGLPRPRSRSRKFTARVNSARKKARSRLCSMLSRRWSSRT